MLVVRRPNPASSKLQCTFYSIFLWFKGKMVAPMFRKIFEKINGFLFRDIGRL